MDSSYLEKLINDFFEMIKVKKTDLYGEDNLKRLLANYIEIHIPTDYKVVTEMNIKQFEIEKKKEDDIKNKSEIDITIYKDDKFKSIKYAIEIKYPNRDDAYTKYLKEAIKDIYFIEDLKRNNFTNTYFLMVLDNDSKFCNPKKNSSEYNWLWEYFSGDSKKSINGPITWVEKHRNGTEEIFNYQIDGNYKIKYNSFDNKKYYLGESNNPVRKEN